MLQNILALTVVILAAIISVFAVIRSLTSKKSSGCDGCSACEVKDESKDRRHHQNAKIDLHSLKIVQTKKV
jgi:hypothetical protein